MIEDIINWLTINLRFSVDSSTKELLFNGVVAADISSVISLLILIVGFFVTLRTLHESIRLNKLQTLPLIHFKYEAAGGGKLSIMNKGNSAAVGIRVEKLFNVNASNEASLMMAGLTITSFKHKNFLGPGEECAVELVSKGPWADWGQEMNLYSMFREKKPVKYYVWYKDLSNRPYVMRLAVYNEDSDMAGIPMVYGIRMRAVLLAYRIKDYSVVLYNLIALVYVPNVIEWVKRTSKKEKK